MRTLLAIAVVLLAGCSTETRTASVERTRGMQGGQPVELITTREERAQSETSADIGPIVQAAVQAAVGDIRGAVQSLAARPQPVQADELAKLISSASDRSGFDPATSGALGGAAGLALLAMREWAAHRATKRDSDEAWDEIKRNAQPKEA